MDSFTKKTHITMLEDQDNVFEIIYSLPVMGHSTAISTRSPSGGYGQQSKYMPDYGGILETPSSKLKNNALASGLPFQPTSIYRNISKLQTPHGLPLSKQFSNDSLIVTPYLHSNDPNEFSVIRAIGRHLYFDLIQDIVDDLDVPRSIVTNYVLVPYSNDITGIKLSGNQSNLLTVKFVQGVKTIKMNPRFQVPKEDGPSTRGSSGFAIDMSASVTERQTLRVKDVCLNPFNKSIQAIASDNFNISQVKIFDLSSESRKPIQTITMDSKDPTVPTSNNNERVLRGRVVRLFEPARPALRGIQEIDNIPYHLVNMLLTTDQGVELIDPRLNRVAQIYVDRTQIPSFYPIEYLRRTQYSIKNSHQFYSLSNVHLRVFDTRFPKVAVNQLNHMLDSETYDSMNLKTINIDHDAQETICASSLGRLGFFTFDQSQKSKLINPRATHMPYHEPSLEEMVLEGNSELFGLGVRDRTENKGKSMKEMFSVYQLTDSGDISVRKFLPSDQDFYPDLTEESRATKVLRRDKLSSEILNSKTRKESEFEDRDILDTEVDSGEAEYIDLLDTDIFSDVENRFQSKRAAEKYEKMPGKLERS